LIGIIAIQNESFLILITGIEPIGRIQGDEIFKITSTHFVSFSAKNEYLYSQQPKSPASPVQKFIQSEAGLMFFSFDYHLTHSLQRQQQMSAELESKVRTITMPDKCLAANLCRLTAPDHLFSFLL
jgi:hypothetical protein